MAGCGHRTRAESVLPALRRVGILAVFDVSKQRWRPAVGAVPLDEV